MEELQRYRNTVYGIHRWCASNKVANLITTQIMEVAKDNIGHDDHTFREKLNNLPKPKRIRPITYSFETIDRM